MTLANPLLKFHSRQRSIAIGYQHAENRGWERGSACDVIISLTTTLAEAVPQSVNYSDRASTGIHPIDVLRLFMAAKPGSTLRTKLLPNENPGIAALVSPPVIVYVELRVDIRTQQLRHLYLPSKGPSFLRLE